MRLTSEYISENRIQAGLFSKKSPALNLFWVQYEDIHVRDSKTFYTLAVNESEIEKSFSGNKNYKFVGAEQIPDNDLTIGLDRYAKFYDLEVTKSRDNKGKEFKIRIKGDEEEIKDQIFNMGFSITSLKESKDQKSSQKQAPAQPAPAQPAPAQPAPAQPAPAQPAPAQPAPAQPAPAQPAPTQFFKVTIKNSEGDRYTVKRKGPYSKIEQEMTSKGFTITNWWFDNDDNEDSAQTSPAQPNTGQTVPAQPSHTQSNPGQTAPNQPNTGNVFQDNQVVNLLLKKGLTGVDIKKLVNKGIMMSPQPTGFSSSRSLRITPYYTRISAQPSQGQQKPQRRPYNIFSDPEVISLLRKKGLPQDDIEDLYQARAKKLYQIMPKHPNPGTSPSTPGKGYGKWDPRGWAQNAYYGATEGLGNQVGKAFNTLSDLPMRKKLKEKQTPSGWTRFKFTALNNEGASFRGYVDAENKNHALSRIKSRGLWTQNITPMKRTSSLNFTPYYTRVSFSSVESKQEPKNNPWDICTSQVGRTDKSKYEDCVLDVKKKTHYHD